MEEIEELQVGKGLKDLEGWVKVREEIGETKRGRSEKSSPQMRKGCKVRSSTGMWGHSRKSLRIVKGVQAGKAQLTPEHSRHYHQFFSHFTLLFMLLVYRVRLAKIRICFAVFTLCYVRSQV